MRIRDPEWNNSDPGSGMEEILIPDPEHCLCGRWYLKLKCASCGEVPDHFQYITQTEKQPLKGSTATQYVSDSVVFDKDLHLFGVTAANNRSKLLQCLWIWMWIHMDPN
jgi:hypothetical protein